ncbi:unnamed protein product, partial [Mycena citricolor]
ARPPQTGCISTSFQPCHYSNDAAPPALNYAPYRHQPAKAVFLLWQLCSAVLRIPYYALSSAIPSSRPRQSWTFRRAFRVKLLRYLSSLGLYVGYIMKVPDHLALKLGPEYHGLWVEPVDITSLPGNLKRWAAAADISAVRLPGYWIHRKDAKIELGAPLMPGEKILYALHGGGYTRLSAHPGDITSAIPRGFLDHVEPVLRTFSIEYRLSTTTPYPKAHSFPAALIDALTGYHYLVNTLGFSADDIIVEGDSAGGNLALALVRYLSENPNPKLPVPGALVLLSPWCDMGNSHSSPGSSIFTCRPSDYIAIPENGIYYETVAFAGPFGLGALDFNAYFSPASKNIPDVSFSGFPRTFISAGGSEILVDSIRTLRDKMVKSMGAARVEYLEMEDAVHDFVVLASIHERERTETLNAIAKWISS